MDEFDYLDEVDVIAKIPPAFHENVASKKWGERRDALQELLDLLTSNPKLATKANYNVIVDLLKSLIEKDANINVCALATKCMTCVAKGLRTKFAPYAPQVVPVILEKFKEKKPLVRDPLIDCIDAVSSSITADQILDDLTTAMGKPNPSIKVQTNQFLYRYMKRFNAANQPKKLIKAVLPLLCKHAEESDQEVREASFQALGSIARLMPDNILASLIGPLASDALKMGKIAEAKEKAAKETAEEAAALAPTAPAKAGNVGSAGDGGSDATASASAAHPSIVVPEVDPWDMLDPVDVIGKLPDNFHELIESKKWLERKEALEAFHKLLTDNPRLCPKQSYGETVDLLKKLLEKDANINVQAMTAKCLTGVAKGLRAKFAHFAPAVVPIVFERFKEKKPLLRDPLVECIDAIYSTTTFTAICDETMAALGKPNPHIKIQADLFLYRVFKKLNATNAPKKELKALAPILIKASSGHTSDSDPEVRDAACSALGAIMKAIGKKSAGVLLKDLENDKPKMAKIEEFHDKAVAEAGPEEVNAMVQSIHKPDKPAVDAKGDAPVKIVKKPPTPSPPPEEEEVPAEEPLKLGGKSTAEEEQAAKQEKKKKERSPSRGRAAPPKVAEAPQELLAVDSDRKARMKEERNPRTLKWNFDSPTQEHREYLTGLLSEVCKPPLITQFLATDLKSHLKALEYLQEELASNPQAIVNNVDLLMKWSTLRLFETNPAVHLKLLDFWISALQWMETNGEQLNEPEVNCFMPYILMKSGDTKDVVRNQVKRIIRLVGAISPPARVFGFLLDGLKTKNSRQKAECLQIIDSFLEYVGVNITPTPQVTMKTIGACIADRDSSVRNAALNAVVTVYKTIGDRAFTLIGQLNPKEKSLLDERIKRAGRDAKAAPDTGDDFKPPLTSTPQSSRGTQRKTLNLDDTFTVDEGREPAGMNRTYTVPHGETSFSDQLNSFAKQGHRLALTQPGGLFALDPKFLEVIKDQPTQLFDSQQKYVLKDTDNLDLSPIQPVARRTQRVPRRSESISSISSIESVEHIDRVVCNLSSTTVETVNEALGQLDYLVREGHHTEYLAERAELIVKTLVTQWSFIRNQHLSDQANLSDTSELLRQICNFVVNFVRAQHKSQGLMEKISPLALKQLLDEILQVMCDDRLNKLETKHQIIRSLNVIVVRICEHGDPTSIFLAITRLLLQYHESDSAGRMLTLARKCVFKLSDSLMNEKWTLRLEMEKVFDCLHEFYQVMKPRNSESAKESCGAMDHYIQRLVIIIRYKILNHVYHLPQDSHVVSYTRRCVRALAKKDEENSAVDPNETIQKSPIPRVLQRMVEGLEQTVVTGGVEELFYYMEIHREHEAHLSAMLENSVLEYVVKDAFKQLSDARARKEVLPIGECVIRTLDDEHRAYVRETQEFGRMLDEFAKAADAVTSQLGNDTTPTNGDDPDATLVAPAAGRSLKPSRRSEPIRPFDPNESFNSSTAGSSSRRFKLTPDAIDGFKKRLQNVRAGSQDTLPPQPK